MFSEQHRLASLKNFSSKEYDVVIVGGGINGAGIARDAASRGLSVALIEAGDYAVGTSSRSSKLIHGGIRYLENFEFKLVFEALAERATLFEMAPHLVHPLRFIIPIFKDSRVGFFKMGLGMWLYDILAAFETPQMHEGMNANETITAIPGINQNNLVGAFAYSDAYTDDDRLVIETLRSAKRYGADLVNYCRAIKAQWNGESIESITYRDDRSGQEGQIKGRYFVSAVGPWTDIFGRQVVNQWQNKMRPTKGVHITFSRRRLPIEQAVVMAVEKRIIFVIPRHEMVIVGTTDTDYKEDPSDVQVQNDDIEYLLKALESYFPHYKLGNNDIVACYAGVRPLVADGSSSEGKTSREHQFFHEGENLLFVAGGKYTTYRKIAEEGVDHLINKMSFEEKSAIASTDTHLPLNPKATPALMERLRLAVSDLADEYGLPEIWVRKAIERHGEEAYQLLEFAQNLELDDPREKYWVAEARFAIENTCCLTLEDFYWRRSPLFLSEADNGVGLIDTIADCFQHAYAWSEDQRKAEIENLSHRIKFELSWRQPFSAAHAEL